MSKNGYRKCPAVEKPINEIVASMPSWTERLQAATKDILIING